MARVKFLCTIPLYAEPFREALADGFTVTCQECRRSDSTFVDDKLLATNKCHELNRLARLDSGVCRFVVTPIVISSVDGPQVLVDPDNAIITWTTDVTGEQLKDVMTSELFLKNHKLV